MVMKTYEGMFACQYKNSGTNLPFPSLLTPSIFAKQKRKEEPRPSPNRHFSPSNLERKELNGGFRKLMYSITGVTYNVTMSQPRDCLRKISLS